MECLPDKVAIQLLLPLFFESTKQTWYYIKDERDIYECSYNSQNNESEIRKTYSQLYENQTQYLGDLKNKVKEMREEILDLIIG